MKSKSKDNNITKEEGENEGEKEGEIEGEIKEGYPCNEINFRGKGKKIDKYGLQMEKKK